MNVSEDYSVTTGRYSVGILSNAILFWHPELRYKMQKVRDKSSQRVLPLGTGWIVKSDNSKTFMVVTITQREAISIARSLARREHDDLIIHNRNGQIKKTFSYR